MSAMFVSFMLMLSAAEAQYSGVTCLDPMQKGSDSCEDKECRITGDSRRRIGRVGAKFCMDGVYKNIWYNTSTTEAGCNGSLLTNIAGSLAADFSTEWDATATKKKKQASGQCYVQDNAAQTTSRKHTCSGVADGGQPVTMVFEGSASCDGASWTRNESNWVHQINGYPAPCFCNSDEDMYTPTSSCSSCDISENQCSDRERCTKSRRDMCSWSNNLCSCKTKNYRKKGVCVGGALHDTYFQSSSWSACNSFTTGAYVAFPTNSRRRGGATACHSGQGEKSSSVAPDYTKYQYMSHREQDCSGVADGKKPNRVYYKKTGCVDPIPNITESRYTSSWDDCSCMEARDGIKSECRSCSGTECGSQAACTMSEEGTCAWDGSKCSCASNIFKHEDSCWDGAPAELIFQNVDISKCTSGDAASVTVAKAKDISDDESWTQCRTGWDPKTAGDTFYKEKSCTGVANGKPAKKAYYSDSSCSTFVSSVAADSGDGCKCELYNGCKANTTFEKYFCDGTGSTAKITAVEYSDGACSSPTGVNRTLTSITDAADLGVCSAWPPIALKPNFDMSLILKCKGAKTPPHYHAWSRTNFDSIAPQCGASPVNYESADHIGQVTECMCKDEYMFNEIAKRQNVQVTGDLTMTVSDVQAAVQDTTFKKIVKQTIADAAGVSPMNIVNLKLEAARRLQELQNSVAPRMLGSGSVKASYIMVVPKAQETNVKTSVTSVTAADLSTAVSTKVTAASLPFTAEVTAKADPASAPATVAVSASGTVLEAGPAPSPGASTGTTSSSILHQLSCAVVLFMAVVAVLTSGS